MKRPGFRTTILIHSILFSVLISTGSAQTTELRFLDVGQGDAVLIRSQGKTALIDAGPSNAIASQLRRLGVKAVDLLIISHPHADHLGGARAVLREIPVQNFLDNGVPHTTAAYRTVMETVEEKRIRYLEASARSFALGTATITVVPPPTATSKDPNLNNQSVGILIEEGSFRTFLSGDSETEAIIAWLRAGAVPANVTVLKAAHHGSRNGLTPAWLSTLKPKVVVISAGAGNTYGHPHATALRYYLAGGRTVLRTDLGGDIAFKIQPNGSYTIERGLPQCATMGGC
jgi:competence protein ComEC